MHTPLTVIVPIRKGQDQVLRARILGLEASLQAEFAKLPMVHFASFSIAGAFNDTPTSLVFEANIDGAAAPFLDALIGRCGSAFDAIFALVEGFPASGCAMPELAREFLLRNDVGADTYFVGCAGRTVTQIAGEDALRDEIGRVAEAGANAPAMRRGESGSARDYLRQGVLSNRKFGWATPPAERPPEVRYRVALVVGVIIIAIAILVAAGTLALHALAQVLACTWVKEHCHFCAPVLRVLNDFLPHPCLGGLNPLDCVDIAHGWDKVAAFLIWAVEKLFVAIVFVAAVVIFVLGPVSAYLQYYDRKVARSLPPILEPDWSRDSDIIKMEYRFGRAQNHLASVTEVNHPLWLRRFMLGVVLWVINLFGRIWYNQGDLGGIPGIHFARWVVFDKGRRLLFLSNYDGGWDGYLSDFVQFSFRGLNGIWGNTRMAKRSYPPTLSFLWWGAQFEWLFKAYAGASQVPTLFWYRAYEHLCTDNINNNTAVREGMTGEMTTAQADAWLRRI